MVEIIAIMSPQECNQITVTLSDRAMEEYHLVAKWLNKYACGYPRNKSDSHYRAKTALEPQTAEHN